MSDSINNYGRSELGDPATDAGTVTPNDATDLADLPKALYVGGTGNVTLQFPDKAGTVLFANVQAGSTLPVRPARVFATGTTATNIVALY